MSLTIKEVGRPIGELSVVLPSQRIRKDSLKAMRDPY